MLAVLRLPGMGMALRQALHVCVQGDSMTEAFRCIEMQEQRPWTYGVDAYGICAVAHCMLFGDYMHVVKAVDPSGGTQTAAFSFNLNSATYACLHGLSLA